MNEPKVKQQPQQERVVYERCLCREAIDELRDFLGVSPAVREHLRSSRIEFPPNLYQWCAGDECAGQFASGLWHTPLVSRHFGRNQLRSQIERFS